MKITDFLTKQAIASDLKSKDKKGVIDELAELVAPFAGVEHDELVRVLMDREWLGSTGIGHGIGIPHGKLNGLEKTILGFGLSKTGVDFESIDGKPVYIFFLLITPDKSKSIHLKLLASISKSLRKDDFKQKLLDASDRDEIFLIIKEEDKEF